MKIGLRNNRENGPQSYTASTISEKSHKDFEQQISLEGFGATEKEAYQSLQKATLYQQKKINQLLAKIDKTLDYHG